PPCPSTGPRQSAAEVEHTCSCWIRKSLPRLRPFRRSTSDRPRYARGPGGSIGPYRYFGINSNRIKGWGLDIATMTEVRGGAGVGAGVGVAARVMWAAARAGGEPSVTDVRISRQEGTTRISIGTSESAQFRAHMLGAPYRIVIDLPPVDWRLGNEARVNSP